MSVDMAGMIAVGLTVLSYVIRLERRLTRIETKLDNICHFDNEKEQGK